MLGYHTTIIVPGLSLIRREYSVSAKTASYAVSVNVLFLGLGPSSGSPLPIDLATARLSYLRSSLPWQEIWEVAIPAIMRA